MYIVLVNRQRCNDGAHSPAGFYIYAPGCVGRTSEVEVRFRVNHVVARREFEGQALVRDPQEGCVVGISDMRLIV